MDKNGVWTLFEKTGSIDAYLLYNRLQCEAAFMDDFKDVKLDGRVSSGKEKSPPAAGSDNHSSRAEKTR